MRGIAKAFPGAGADDVADVQAGECTRSSVRTAGQSTPPGCMALAPRGEILFRGETVRIASPADARRLGVAVIFQEFSLVPYLDIAHNIFLGREFRGRIPGSIGHRRMHAESRRLLALLGIDLDTRTPAHRLGVAQQQLVEIAKALSQDARLLVMDEPTAALSEREIERLFKVIGMLKQDGVAIIYIPIGCARCSRWEIEYRAARRPQGRLLRPNETSVDELVHMMVGHEVDTTYRHRFCAEPGARCSSCAMCTR